MQGNLLVPFLEGLEAVMLPGYSARKSQQCGFLTRQVGPLTANLRQMEEMRKIGYVRVSKQEQIDALKEAGCEKWFIDKITGSKAERKGLDEALAYVRPGDTFVVWKLDRAGRSLTHLI